MERSTAMFAGATESCTHPATVRDDRPTPGTNMIPEAVLVRQGMEAALRRACSWRVPTQWTRADWKDELRSVALVAAWQAQLVFAPEPGRMLKLFVLGRVLARLLTRYRQEWRTALREVHPDPDESFTVLSDEGHAVRRECRLQALEHALHLLPSDERWLLDELFRSERSQEDIGHELGISQPAVHKRKRLALAHLRQRFEELDQDDR